jgi:hypothetical protein
MVVLDVQNSIFKVQVSPGLVEPAFCRASSLAEDKLGAFLFVQV